MSPDRIDAIDRALRALSIDDRLAALVMSVIEANPDAVGAVTGIVSTAAIMARRLSSDERRTIVFHMMVEANELEARWH